MLGLLIQESLLVRVIDKGPNNAELRLRVFGTALATEDVVCNSVPNFAQRWKSLEQDWNMEVQLDAGTIFMLLD